jgi:hypothetical protein
MSGTPELSHGHCQVYSGPRWKPSFATFSARANLLFLCSKRLGQGDATESAVI